MNNFCIKLILFMAICSSAHAGVTDKILSKVLPPAPYTTQAGMDIARAQRQLEKPIVGAGMSDKQRVEVLLSYLRSAYSNAGYSLDASIAKFVKDVGIAGGIQPLVTQVTETQSGRNDWSDTALFLTSTYASSLAEMANDPKFTPYFPPKLLVDLRVLSMPSAKPETSAPKLASPPLVQNEVPQAAARWKPSFDCAKAASFSEKAICSDSLLGQLDGALSENYKYMLASDIGDGAKKDLKQTQKRWLAERNKCTSNQCLADAYKKRMDEICEYPVISGVHPICTSSDEVQ